jgi:hypothetical protein
MAHSRLWKTGFTAVLLASSALFTAAWAVPAQADPGGGGAFKVVGASYTQDIKFASCMRRHGEPGFPDPSSNGVFSLEGIDPNSPQYHAAQKACQGQLPKQNPPTPAEEAKLLAKALAYAQCMRSHGVPNFSDPNSRGGGISFSLSGVDPNSPQFQRAQEACQKLSPFPGGGLGVP